MESMEEKISSVLNNPQLMQQIMSMAQSIGQSQAANEESQENNDSNTFPAMDIAAIQKISSLAMQSGIDTNQQALLSALMPYLPQDRVSRLERAMRAAKMAKFASAFLTTGR